MATNGSSRSVSIKKLEGKSVAIVALGESQLDYHMSISHSVKFDEVWAINSMCAVIKADRVFMMDPASRFFDTEDAGPQTKIMRETLPKLKCPVYSCVKDKRVPRIELYPIESLIDDMGCGYFNNTISYAIAFALWNKVGRLSIYGADFTYKRNRHFAEMGRSCCEFWLSKCIDKGMDIKIAAKSSLLDTNIPEKYKLYGYHRLDDPPVVYFDEGQLKITKHSEVQMEHSEPVGISGRTDNVEVVDTVSLRPPEPNKF